MVRGDLRFLQVPPCQHPSFSPSCAKGRPRGSPAPGSTVPPFVVLARTAFPKANLGKALSRPGLAAMRSGG